MREGKYTYYGLDMAKDEDLDLNSPAEEYIGILMNSSRSDEEIKQQMLRYYEFHDTKVSREIDFLRETQRKQDKKIRSRKTTNTDDVSYKSELQHFYLDCISEYKRKCQNSRYEELTKKSKSNPASIEQDPEDYFTKVLVFNEQIWMYLHDKMFAKA